MAISEPTATKPARAAINCMAGGGNDVLFGEGQSTTSSTAVRREQLIEFGTEGANPKTSDAARRRRRQPCCRPRRAIWRRPPCHWASTIVADGPNSPVRQARPVSPASHGRIASNPASSADSDCRNTWPGRTTERATSRSMSPSTSAEPGWNLAASSSNGGISNSGAIAIAPAKHDPGVGRNAGRRLDGVQRCGSDIRAAKFDPTANSGHGGWIALGGSTVSGTPARRITRCC